MVLKPSRGQGWVLLESSWPWGVPCPNSVMYCPFILLSCLLLLTGDSSWWRAGDTTPRRSGQAVQNGGIVPISVLFGLTVARRRERQGCQAQQPLHLRSMGACVCQGRGDPRQVSGRDFWRLLQVTGVWLGNFSVYLPLLGGRKEESPDGFVCGGHWAPQKLPRP